MNTNTTALVPEFLAFTKARGLTGDAEECLIAATTDADRAWLRDFIARWNRAELRAEVVARFTIGEALDGGAGSLILAGNVRAGFQVFVDGGLLPDGRDVAGFDGEFAAVEALEYAVDVARALVVDSVEA